MKKIIIAMVFGLLAFQAAGQQEHKATVWGAKSDGITDNTGSIQRAVDFISENGGGTLVFYVGRYVTGAIELKPNVTIRLEEAAVLVASNNIYTYKGAPALLWAQDGVDASVEGKGVVELRSSSLEENIADQKSKGHLPADFNAPQAFSGVKVGSDIKILKETAASTKYNQ